LVKAMRPIFSILLGSDELKKVTCREWAACLSFWGMSAVPCVQTPEEYTQHALGHSPGKAADTGRLLARVQWFRCERRPVLSLKTLWQKGQSASPRGARRSVGKTRLEWDVPMCDWTALTSPRMLQSGAGQDRVWRQVQGSAEQRRHRDLGALQSQMVVTLWQLWQWCRVDILKRRGSAGRDLNTQGWEHPRQPV
jgi:hypothetical protein